MISVIPKFFLSKLHVVNILKETLYYVLHDVIFNTRCIVGNEEKIVYSFFYILIIFRVFEMQICGLLF